MKLNCNVIRDLLPLYADQICSDESRELVNEHLMECGDCAMLLQQMRSTELVTDLQSETQDVLSRQAGFFKRKSALLGTVISGIFMIPILVCLIVNLVAGAALDWFFIVLASLITAASLIVVPLMIPKNKFLWTLGTFTASLLLLLGVICLYTHGRWFFMVSLSVLLGFSVCFLPFAVYARPLRALLGNQKGLTVMTVSTVFFGLMMLSIGLYTKSSAFWRIAPVISLPIAAFVWLLFLLIRYTKMRGWFKAGISVALIGVFSFFADGLINRWLDNRKAFPVFRPFVWRGDTIDGNVKWLLLLVCILAGIVLIAVGVVRSTKEKDV